MGKVQPWPVLRWPPSVSSNFVWRFLCSALHHLFLGSFLVRLARLARKADSTPRVKYACKLHRITASSLERYLAVPRRGIWQLQLTFEGLIHVTNCFTAR